MSGSLGSDPRIERLAAWEEPVTRVRYVDDRRAGLLQKLGVRTVGDLVRHYPHRHLDLTTAPSLSEVVTGQEATVVGRVHEVRVKRLRKGFTIVEVALVDGTGVLLGVWFNQPFMADRFSEGERVAFAGKVVLDHGLKQIRNPFIEKLADVGEAERLGRLIPLHPTTEGLTANWLRRLVTEALAEFGDVPDPLPSSIRVTRGLMPAAEALLAIHFPDDAEHAEEARRRLAYEEFFLLQLLLAQRRETVARSPGITHSIDGSLQAAVIHALPFTLTEDQQSAVDAILADMASSGPMNRLLLGDVGTGKTAVAAVALAVAADGGHQAAMMAPTEVLATQYSKRVGPIFDAAGIAWSLLTGSTPVRERRELMERLASGRLDVLFGTHALFSEDVVFARLGLVVVDEQHRFGVSQRLSLREKGDTCDLLVMTATPIPRSLTLTLYGDLDTSYLRERPSGRSPGEAIRTRLVHRNERSEAYRMVREAAADGRRTYVICPFVEESEEADAKAATKESGRLARDVFPDLSVGLLTGRMASHEKTGVMERFRSGDIDVLVATTVVEVGVDVPEASVMIVEGAERFGLAQLHQLRGRVGRGEAVGEFLLFADPSTDEGRRRMAAIETVSDGFELAEMDLQLRGEGDVLGTRQSGVTGLKAASVVRDLKILEEAREDVSTLLMERGPTNGSLAAALLLARQRFSEAQRWAESG